MKASFATASVLKVMMHTRSVESKTEADDLLGAAERLSSFIVMNQFVQKLPSCEAMTECH